MSLSKAFISHVAEDREVAVKLKNDLKDYDVDCWCFEEDLNIADEIIGAVKAEIEKSDFIIIILSSKGLKSKWIQWEIGYALQLHVIRNGVKRPIIIPVHDFKFIKQTMTIQPLEIGTDKPFGSDIKFYEHKCHKLSDDSALPVLARQLIPQLTEIREPDGAHADLFQSLTSIWESLFPDQFSRPDFRDVSNWIISQYWDEDAVEWPELILVTHFGPAVTGFLEFNYHKQYNYAYGAFIGIYKPWRSSTRFRWFIKEAEKILLERRPGCLGLFFEVDFIDFDLIGNYTENNSEYSNKSDVFLEQCRRLARINLFQNMGGLLLLDKNEMPLLVTQPCMMEPLNQKYEKKHFLMLKPSRLCSVPEFSSSFFDMYYDLARVGFGPTGSNLPNYSEYLADCINRQKKLLVGGERFGKLQLTAGMKKMLTEFTFDL